MLQTVEAIIEPDGTIRLLEKLRITHTTRALLTLLESPLPISTQPEKGTGAAILAFLKQNTLKPEQRRSTAEINQYIQRA